jgi:hypothetical protein
MLKINTIISLVFFISLVGCDTIIVEEEKEKEKKPTTADFANTFVTLNDKIESSQSIIELSIENDLQRFYDVLLNLKSYNSNEIEQIKQLQPRLKSIRHLAIALNNFFVQESSKLIKYSGDSQFGKKDIEAAPLEHHYKVIKGESDHNIYRLLPIRHLERKGDYKSPTEYFIGPSGVVQNPIGQYIFDSIINYRNSICMLIANYIDKQANSWSMSSSNLHLDMDSENGISNFLNELSLEMANVNPKDTAVIKQLFRLLTPPYLATSYGEELPYIAKLFYWMPLAGAITVLNSFISDTKTAENIAINHLVNRVAGGL